MRKVIILSDIHTTERLICNVVWRKKLLLHSDWSDDVFWVVKKMSRVFFFFVQNLCKGNEEIHSDNFEKVEND